MPFNRESIAFFRRNEFYDYVIRDNANSEPVDFRNLGGKWLSYCGSRIYNERANEGGYQARAAGAQQSAPRNR